ncbi:MAG TPA: condensation domain-containing protein, partial [Gammaproteobacteria bacterium]
MSAETGQACQFSSVRRDTPFHDIAVPLQDHEQILFVLDARIDAGVFVAAWRKLGERHAILRTGFHESGQFFDPDCRPQVETLDWRNETGDAARAARLQAYLANARRQGLRDDCPPLYRVALIRWNDATYRVAWTLRRGLLDWRSISTLLRELFANYHAAVNGGTEGAAALIPEQPNWPGPAATKTDTAFWQDYLADCKLTRLDLPPPAKADDEDAFSGIERRIDVASSNSVRRLAKAAGVTLNNLAQSAWALLLSHYARTDDVVFGILRSCRRSGPPGLEDAVGSFLNIIPLRTHIAEDINVFELLWQLRDENRKVREHEGSQLGEIEQCANNVDAALFDTVLEFDQRDPMCALGELLGDEGARDFRHYSGPMARLHVQVHDEEEIIIRLKHDPAFIDKHAAKHLLEQYANLMTGMAREPWRQARDVPYLGDDERAPLQW